MPTVLPRMCVSVNSDNSSRFPHDCRRAAIFWIEHPDSKYISTFRVWEESEHLTSK